MMERMPIIGEIKMVMREDDGLYHLWTGNRWATFDDPEIDNVFDLMEIEPSRRAAMREYYSSRTLPRHVDDKAVSDFTRVYNQVITDPDKAGEHLDELAKIIGADGPEPDAGPPPLGLIDKLRKE